MTIADDARMVERGEDEATTETVATNVTAHRSSPERTVFTEEGNTDAWIATDTTVSLDN